MQASATIDLNADLGEGGTQDAALIARVTSVNIACGWHAGDPDTMRSTVRMAAERQVAIGAHPSFPDREHFGRRVMDLPPSTVYTGMLYQIGALAAIAHAEGAIMTHVKPHGALYNQAARDRALAESLVAAVLAVDRRLAMVALAGSELVAVARQAGLTVLEEVFADRRYQADGTLVGREHKGALIEDTATAIAQTLGIVRSGTVETIDGGVVSLRADTICLHGDNAHALAFADALVLALNQAGILVRSP